MRTTLTLDDDTYNELKELCRERNEKFRSVLNEALRAGLLALSQEPGPRSEKPYRTKPVSLGEPRLPNIDNISEVLSVAEGDLRR